jgi:hypothetical protein
MSDVQAATQPGAATFSNPDESSFQGLWDSGAFDPNGVPPKDGNEGTANAAPAAQTPPQEAAPQVQAQEDAQPQIGDQNAQPQAEEPQTYASLNDLLTAHKIDPESVLGLHVTAKIDGKETQVPLSDVIKSYQLEGHVNNKSIELSNQKAAHDRQIAEWRAATQTALNQHQQMGQLALQMLNHDFAKVDWNALRQNNPAEFAAMQAEFGNRQQQIQGFLAQVQQQQAHEAAQQQQALQQNLAKEQERLISARPEWKDSAAFAKASEKMKQYARSVGFQDAELSQIFDHRYMLILDDAARYRELQAAAPQALKQVRQAPPQAAPGSRTNANPNDARRSAAIDRFNRNPGDEDAQAAVFSLFTD